MSGGCRPNARRSSAGVSPVRIATRTSRAGLDPQSARGQRDAGQRRAQVALHVVDERLQRRHVEHAQPAQRVGRHRLAQQPVEAPQERRQRLARAGGAQISVCAAGSDGRPALRLGRRGGVERSAEPGSRCRPECGQRIGAGPVAAGGSTGHGRASIGSNARALNPDRTSRPTGTSSLVYEPVWRSVRVSQMARMGGASLPGRTPGRTRRRTHSSQTLLLLDALAPAGLGVRR